LGWFDDVGFTFAGWISKQPGRQAEANGGFPSAPVRQRAALEVDALARSAEGPPEAAGEGVVEQHNGVGGSEPDACLTTVSKWTDTGQEL
jgi:hypothetical protein